MPSRVGQKRREFMFWQRPLQHAQPHWNVIKPSMREAAVEMPQPRNNYPDHRNGDIGPGLVENQKIEPSLARDLDAGIDLFARVAERAELGAAGARVARRLPIRG